MRYEILSSFSLFGSPPASISNFKPHIWPASISKLRRKIIMMKWVLNAKRKRNTHLPLEDLCKIQFNLQSSFQLFVSAVSPPLLYELIIWKDGKFLDKLNNQYNGWNNESFHYSNIYNWSECQILISRFKTICVAHSVCLSQSIHFSGKNWNHIKKDTKQNKLHFITMKTRELIVASSFWLVRRNSVQVFVCLWFNWYE